MNFSPELINVLEKIGKKVTYKKGAVLFYEGDKATNLYILLKGCVRLFKTDEQGGVINIHFLYAQNFIAEMPVFEQIPYPASADFETDGEVLSIRFDVFNKSILEDQKFLMIFVKSLMYKIRFLERSITQNFSLNAEQRFINFLIEKKESCNLFSQRQIANFINITPETLSRLIKHLKQEGLIATSKGKIEILNIAGLRSKA